MYNLRHSWSLSQWASEFDSGGVGGGDEPDAGEGGGGHQLHPAGCLHQGGEPRQEQHIFDV